MSADRIMAAAAGVLALGLLVWALGTRGESGRCDGGSTDWMTGRLVQVQARLTEGGQAYATTSAESAGTLLVVYANRLAAAEADSCRMELAAPVRACLDRRKAQALALTEALVEAGPEATEHAVASAVSLPPVAGCKGAGTPVSAELAAKIDRASALATTGRVVEATELAGRVLASAGGEPAAEAEALLLLGHEAATAGKTEAAAELLDRACVRATAAGADALTLECALSRAELMTDDSATRMALDQALALAQRLGMGEAWPARVGALRGRMAGARAPAQGATALENAAARLEGPHPDRLELWLEAATLHLQADQADAALSAATNGFHAGEAVFGPGHPRVALAHGRFGLALLAAGAVEAAVPFLKRHPATLRGSAGTRGAAEPSLALGFAHLAEGELDDAVTALQGAVEVAELAQDDDAFTRAALGLGMAHYRQGKLAEAVDKLKQGLTRAEAAQTADPSRLAGLLLELGRVERDLGHTDNAVEHHVRAVELLARDDAGDEVGDAMLVLAESFSAADDHASALRVHRKALDVFVASGGENHPGTHLSLIGIGAECLALERPKDAVAALSRAVDLLAAAKADRTTLTSARLSLATALWESGRSREAKALAGEVAADLEANGDTQAVGAADVAAWHERRGIAL